MSGSIQDLANELNISHNTIRRQIKNNECFHKYVAFNKLFMQVRIDIIDYEGLKNEIISQLNR